MSAMNDHSGAKDHQVTVSQQLLGQYETEVNVFLDQIITGDETWCHYYEPESKQLSMEWHHSHSPPTKKFLVTVLSKQSDVYCLLGCTKYYLLGFFATRGNCQL